ncbi:MAG TPA: glycosyltransferase [Patescibacteria group bacterium]|nr:glycosyltransferase [Patescibacteria group bacterium]
MARIDIVMTARERHSLTLRAIDQVFAHTPPSFRFHYLDVQSPPAIRAGLAERAARGDIEWHVFDELLWPQAARRRIVPALDGDYVVFIDNDVIVEPGWLDALVHCAEETGAGIVGPLYLWGDGVARPKIHMAGGRIVEQQVPGGRVLDESHFLINADPEAEKLARRRCDFAEFHCMLVRRELLQGGELLDPAIRCVHEHIDIALGVRAQGAEIWFEPSSRVTYLAFAPFTVDDLQILRSRWDMAEGEASIAAFAHKWGVIDDARSFAGVRSFLDRHVARIDPLRPGRHRQDEQRAPMQKHELAQTRSDLLDLAMRHGYSGGDLQSLSDACARAQLVMNAGYRPCGRPFLCHLIGTASVLVRFGFRIDVVAAGLLHAAYTHCPPLRDGPMAAIAQIESMLGGRGSAVERLVRDYTLRDAEVGRVAAHEIGAITMHDVEILMLVAANEIDMHLSGEIRFSGRSDLVDRERLERIATLSRAIGAPGIGETLNLALADSCPVARAWQTGGLASYRIGGGTPAPVSMLSGLPRILAARAQEAPSNLDENPPGR